MGRHPAIDAASAQTVFDQGSTAAAARHRRCLGTARPGDLRDARAFGNCGVDSGGSRDDCRSDCVVGAMARQRAPCGSTARAARGRSRRRCLAAGARDSDTKLDRHFAGRNAPCVSRQRRGWCPAAVPAEARCWCDRALRLPATHQYQGPEPRRRLSWSVRWPRRRGSVRWCWRPSHRKIPGMPEGKSNSSANTRSETSAICWSKSRRIRRCSTGSTAG